MKWLFLILSYLMGFSVLLFEDTHLFLYLFILFLYLALTDYFAPMFHRVLVLDPLALAYTSVLLLSVLEDIGELMFVKYVIMFFFLLGYYHLRGELQKKYNEKEPVTIHFYVKRLVLPIVCPIAFYFAVQLFIPTQFALTLYWLFYFFVVLYFTKYIQTAFYFGYFVITQLLIMAYLLQFMDNLFVSEKIMLYLFLLVTATGRYLYKRTRGGEKNVPFVQVLSRKNVQKSENRSRLRERH